jgi:hypothetical protein
MQEAFQNSNVVLRNVTVDSRPKSTVGRKGTTLTGETPTITNVSPRIKPVRLRSLASEGS